MDSQARRARGLGSGHLFVCAVVERFDVDGSEYSLAFCPGGCVPVLCSLLQTK